MAALHLQIREDNDGQPGNPCVASLLQEKQFKTGRQGYGWYGKLEASGKRYQVSLNVVEIQPKGEAEAESKPKKKRQRRKAAAS